MSVSFNVPLARSKILSVRSLDPNVSGVDGEETCANAETQTGDEPLVAGVGGHASNPARMPTDHAI